MFIAETLFDHDEHNGRDEMQNPVFRRVRRVRRG
jgi:hypothetical protein